MLLGAVALLEQEHADLRVGGELAGGDAAGRAAADDDVVELEGACAGLGHAGADFITGRRSGMLRR